MRKSNSFAALIFFVILVIGGLLAFAMHRANMENLWFGVIVFFIAIVVSASIRVAGWICPEIKNK